MCSKNVLRTLILLILLTGISAIALAEGPDKGSANFGWTRPMFVAGTEIQPGDYKVRWEFAGAEASVTFITEGKPSVTVKGKIVEGDKKYERNTSIVGQDASGRDSIKELRISGKKYAIVF